VRRNRVGTADGENGSDLADPGARRARPDYLSNPAEIAAPPRTVSWCQKKFPDNGATPSGSSKATWRGAKPAALVGTLASLGLAPPRSCARPHRDHDGFERLVRSWCVRTGSIRKHPPDTEPDVVVPLVKGGPTAEGRTEEQWMPDHPVAAAHGPDSAIAGRPDRAVRGRALL
jgi:hypothetical protein